MKHDFFRGRSIINGEDSLYTLTVNYLNLGIRSPFEAVDNGLESLFLVTHYPRWDIINDALL